MDIVYADILNSLISKGINTSGCVINIARVNTLLTTLTDVYVTILENGLSAVVGEDIQFKSKHTRDFFIAGLAGLKQAKLPGTLKFLLDFLFIQKSRENNISIDDLFEMYLLSNIIPGLLPDGNCIKIFVDYLVEFCAGGEQHHHLAKFVKYMDTYKVTGCQVLEMVRTLEANKS
jgi:hypothetical protein